MVRKDLQLTSSCNNIWHPWASTKHLNTNRKAKKYLTQSGYQINVKHTNTIYGRYWRRKTLLIREKKKGWTKNLLPERTCYPRNEKQLKEKIVTWVHLTAHSIASTAVSVSAACCEKTSFNKLVQVGILSNAILFALFLNLQSCQRMERKLDTFGVHCAVLVNKSAGSFSPLSHVLFSTSNAFFTSSHQLKTILYEKTDSPGAASVNCTFTRAHLTEL